MLSRAAKPRKAGKLLDLGGECDAARVAKK